MNLAYLENFAIIAEEGNISAAARKLRIAQPALTNQLKNLEARFGAPLLIRGSRQCTLTELGHIVYNRARQISHTVELVQQETADYLLGSAGCLNLGAVPSVSFTGFGEKLISFARENPRVKINLYESNTGELLDLLNNRAIDLCIVRTPFPPSDDYRVLHQTEDNMAAVFAKDAGLLATGTRKSLRIPDLKDVPLLSIRRFESMITDACHQYGFHPRYSCINTHIHSIFSWAREGIGVALVPHTSLSDANMQGLASLPIPDPLLFSKRVVLSTRHRVLTALDDLFFRTCFPEMFEGENAPPVKNG